MTVLLDANTIVRLADPSDPLHPVALAAVGILLTRGDMLNIVPQTLFEFWVVATRPRNRNGLGMTVQETRSEVKEIKASYPVLLDLPGIYDEWEALAVRHACHGKVAHDARYVAAINLHGVTHLLTFNTGDFARFPGITCLDPATVTSTSRIP